MDHNDEEPNVDELFPFNINYNKIASDKDMLPLTRLLAVDLMAKSYLTPGEFFKNISDADLDMINDLDPEHELMAEMLLISQMLVKAEGVYTESFDQMHEQLQTFVTFASLTSLDRKDLIICHYDNMSFGEDSRTNIVAERKKDELWR